MSDATTFTDLGDGTAIVTAIDAGEIIDQGGDPVTSLLVADNEVFVAIGPEEVVAALHRGETVEADVDDDHEVVHVADEWMLSTAAGWM